LALSATAQPVQTVEWLRTDLNYQGPWAHGHHMTTRYYTTGLKFQSIDITVRFKPMRIHVGSHVNQTMHIQMVTTYITSGLTAVALVVCNTIYNHGLRLSPGPVHALTHIFAMLNILQHIYILSNMCGCFGWVAFPKALPYLKVTGSIPAKCKDFNQ
jgi:hypothetical protein